MPLLEQGNNRDNYRGDITNEQPIGKKISYRPYTIIASLMVIFIKRIFLIGYLI